MLSIFKNIFICNDKKLPSTKSNNVNKIPTYKNNKKLLRNNFKTIETPQSFINNN